MIHTAISRYLCLAIMLATCAWSCVSIPKSRYFDGHQDSQFNEIYENIESRIQKADILSISVSSLNPEANKIFNAPNYLIDNPTTSSSSNVSTPLGYLVDNQGFITYPVFGKLKVDGLTKKQLADSITTFILQKDILKDPIVTVRIISFRVTVLGEVGRPAVIPVQNEKISMLEAIGAAGDMLVTARRDNVLLIRVEEGKKITKRIDLNSSDIFTSPYYYLKNNDIIYVEANKAKVQSTSRFTQLLPSLLSGMALIAVIVDQVVQ